MTYSPPQSRRRFLGGLGCLATAGLTGCTDTASTTDSTAEDSGDSESTTDDPADSGSASTDSASTESGNTGNGEPSDLDLREANVVDVSISDQGEDYEFAVTLHHDDDGEEGYANWWQVEQLDGTRLGRRELRHAHSRQPFIRLETITVPAAVSCVVVRGHDQTHGYGGQAMIVTLDSGARRAVDQGEEPDEFAGTACPQP